MQTYGLKTVSENPRVLNLPPMSLSDAEKARDALAKAGTIVRVINLKSE